jgi:hypothetical protein
VTRSRMVVMVGEPIPVAPFALRGVDEAGEPDRADVGRLTEAITASLQAVSPGYADVEERDVLRAAARVHVRATDGAADPSFGRAEVAARRLATATESSRAAVVQAYRTYATRLHLAGLRDDQPARPALRRLVLSAVVLVFAGPLVVAATLVHLPALLLIAVGTGLVRSTATKGTVRLLVGLVTVLATWAIAGVVLADGIAALIAGLTVAVGGVAALVVWTPLVRAIRTLLGWVRLRDRVGLLQPVVAASDDLVDAVRTALEDGT